MGLLSSWFTGALDADGPLEAGEVQRLGALADYAPMCATRGSSELSDGVNSVCKRASFRD